MKAKEKTTWQLKHGTLNAYHNPEWYLGKNSRWLAPNPILQRIKEMPVLACIHIWRNSTQDVSVYSGRSFAA